MSLTNAERETHINITGDNRHVATVWTDDPVWVERLMKWFEPVRVDGESYEFEIKTSLIVRENAMKHGTRALGAKPKKKFSEAT